MGDENGLLRVKEQEVLNVIDAQSKFLNQLTSNSSTCKTANSDEHKYL